MFKNIQIKIFLSLIVLLSFFINTKSVDNQQNKLKTKVNFKLIVDDNDAPKLANDIVLYPSQLNKNNIYIVLMTIENKTSNAVELHKEDVCLNLIQNPKKIISIFTPSNKKIIFYGLPGLLCLASVIHPRLQNRWMVSTLLGIGSGFFGGAFSSWYSGRVSAKRITQFFEDEVFTNCLTIQPMEKIARYLFIEDDSKNIFKNDIKSKIENSGDVHKLLVTCL